MLLKATKQTFDNKNTVCFSNKQEYLNFISQFKDGEELLIEITSKRSLSQNRLFYKIIRIIAEHIGETPEAVKTWLLCKFIGCEETEIEGKIYTVIPSSSKLNKKEFSDLLTHIYIFAAEELHINLPSNEL